MEAALAALHKARKGRANAAGRSGLVVTQYCPSSGLIRGRRFNAPWLLALALLFAAAAVRGVALVVKTVR
jgi:hypothetical protein